MKKYFLMALSFGKVRDFLWTLVLKYISNSDCQWSRTKCDNCCFFSPVRKKMDDLNEPQNCLKVTKDHIPVWTSRSQQPMSWPTQESQPKMIHLWPFPKMSRRARQKKRRISNMLFSAPLHTKCVAKVMFLLLSNCFDISDNYPKGEVCVDKCCRGSKVLQTSPNEKLECVASNGSEWNSENLKLQLGVESLNIRSWLFYLKRNLKVPIISRFNSILIICIA